MHILYELLPKALLHFTAWEHSGRRHIVKISSSLCALRLCTNHPAENKMNADFPISPAGSRLRPPERTR